MPGLDETLAIELTDAVAVRPFPSPLSMLSVALTVEDGIAVAVDVVTGDVDGNGLRVGHFGGDKRISVGLVETLTTALTDAVCSRRPSSSLPGFELELSDGSVLAVALEDSDGSALAVIFEVEEGSALAVAVEDGSGLAVDVAVAIAADADGSGLKLGLFGLASLLGLTEAPGGSAFLAPEVAVGEADKDGSGLRDGSFGSLIRFHRAGRKGSGLRLGSFGARFGGLVLGGGDIPPGFPVEVGLTLMDGSG